MPGRRDRAVLRRRRDVTCRRPDRRRRARPGANGPRGPLARPSGRHGAERRQFSPPAGSRRGARRRPGGRTVPRALLGDGPPLPLSHIESRGASDDRAEPGLARLRGARRGRHARGRPNTRRPTRLHDLPGGAMPVGVARQDPRPPAGRPARGRDRSARVRAVVPAPSGPGDDGRPEAGGRRKVARRRRRRRPGGARPFPRGTYGASVGTLPHARRLRPTARSVGGVRETDRPRI